MNEIEKNRSKKRNTKFRRTRMTVRAFHACKQPDDCIKECNADMDMLYQRLDLNYLTIYSG